MKKKLASNLKNLYDFFHFFFTHSQGNCQEHLKNITKYIDIYFSNKI